MPNRNSKWGHKMGVKSALDPCCLIGQDPRGCRSLRIKKKQKNIKTTENRLLMGQGQA